MAQDWAHSKIRYKISSDLQTLDYMVHIKINIQTIRYFTSVQQIMKQNSTQVYQQLKQSSMSNMSPDDPEYFKTIILIGQFDSVFAGMDVIKLQNMSKQDQKKLNEIESRISNLAKKTFKTGKDMIAPLPYSKSNQQSNVKVQDQLKKLREQLEDLKKKYLQLDKKNEQLELRISKLECELVSKEELQKFKNKYEQKYTLFQGKFRVLEQNDKKMMVYIDKTLKQFIKPTQKFVARLQQLSQKNNRMYQYANKVYWSLMNQILAYRALSTGMISKGYIRGKYKQIGDILGRVSGILGGVPIAGNILRIVSDITSIFFNKQDEIVINNMSKRVQGYLTQSEISEDVANSVLMLVENPNIQIRVLEYQEEKNTNPLIAFLKLVDTIGNSPQMLAELFADKMLGLKKDKDDHNCITENALTDSSLIVWQLVEGAPSNPRKPITSSVEQLLENINQTQKFHLQNNEDATNIVSKQRPKYIKLRVISASITINTEVLGKMDPYCVVKYGKKQYKTQVHQDGHQQPKWEAQFVLETAKNATPIYIQVYDKDKMMKDDFIGMAAIPDTQIEQKNKYLPLYVKEKNTGKILVRITE